MRIITADETGLVKVVRLESGECLAVSQGEQSRANAVRAICFDHAVPASQQQPSSLFARIHVARSAGTVETWDASQSERDGNDGNACALSPLAGAVSCPATPVALACLRPASAGSSEPSRVLTCSGEGEVQITATGPDGVSSDKAKLAAFSIRGPISAAVALGTGGGGGTGSALAAGGKENDLKMWDLSTGQCTWKAKNVPHDFLDMRQPVWVTSLCPLAAPETTGGGGGGGGGTARQQIVAGTAHRQVRLYDARAQKRPTHSVDADEHGITTMAVAPDGREVVVADTAGLVRVLDLRTMKWGRRFEGPAGSVRGLAFHPTLPVLACVGLDRMARVYDYRSREQKFQVYLKQRLNAVLFDAEGEVRIASAVGAKDVKKGSSAKEGEDWSGSEGWGSGEEYEMDEADSSEDEEEEEEGVGRGSGGAGKRNATRPASLANGRKPIADEDDGGEEGSEEEDEESDDDDMGMRGSGEGSSSEQEEDESESEEEEAPQPPSKRRNVRKISASAKKANRR